MTLDESKTYIRFFCSKCDNIDCQYYKKLGYISDKTKQGCSIEIDFDIFERYYHYTEEVMPFWKIIDNQNLINEQYNEIINFLYKKIYNQKIINFYDKQGKVIKDFNYGN